MKNEEKGSGRTGYHIFKLGTREMERINIYTANSGKQRLENNRYWFINQDGENVLNDFHGMEKEAVKYAEKQTKILGENVYVNFGEDIIDVAYP